MPGRDGTGPMGGGTMTGRGLGIFNGVNAVRRGTGLSQGFGLGLAYRRGFGRSVGRGVGSGLGRGFGRMPAVDMNSLNTPKDLLEAQKSILQKRIDIINRRLENL